MSKQTKIDISGRRFLKETKESDAAFALVASSFKTTKSASFLSVFQSKNRSNPAALATFKLRNIRFLSLCQIMEYAGNFDRKPGTSEYVQ
jgi:hypothetical protein